MEGRTDTEVPAENALGQVVSPARASDAWKALVLLAVLVLTTVAAMLLGLGRRLPELQAWIRTLGPAAPLAYILIRAGAAVCLVPGSAFSAVGALLFHPVVAFVCISIAKTLGAAVAFVIARYLAGEAAGQWIRRHPKACRLDPLVRLHGACVVALMRLLPVVPFNVQNYAFGLTPVRFPTYLFWSWLCMLPGALIVVAGFGVVGTVMETHEVPWVRVGIVFGAAALMLGMGLFAFLKVLRLARKA
ncbi:MAG: TVP38/TMEM64 family protein [Candidatus Brocadiaceae bacterium]|nr:TVP38/TMEM64 family protein [Candidatus Brocadiaceae bacterium]